MVGGWEVSSWCSIMARERKNEKRIGRTGKALERSGSRETGVFRSPGNDPRTKMPVNKPPVVAKSKDLAWS